MRAHTRIKNVHILMNKDIRYEENKRGKGKVSFLPIELFAD
jgi:hypothetical protein